MPERSPANTARSTVIVDETTFPLVHTVDQLLEAASRDGRAALRLATSRFSAAKEEFIRALEAKHGAGSRQARDALMCKFMCAGCLWEYPLSYELSFGLPESVMNVISGATPGFREFGKTASCSQCGSGESLLVYEYFDTSKISPKDVDYIRGYWRARASDVLRSSIRKDENCDLCYSDLQRANSFFDDSRMYCENCVNKVLRNALEQLKKDPHYYGQALLRKARSRAT